MDSCQHAGLLGRLQDSLGLALSPRALQLVPYPVARDAAEVFRVAFQQPFSMLFESEIEPRLVAEGPKDSRRIVSKAPVVEDADQSRFQVGPAGQRIDDGAEGRLRHVDRDGVDGEIAPRKVFLNGPRLDLGESAGPGVALGPGHRQVDRQRAGLKRGGAEAAVRDDGAPDLIGDGASQSRHVGTALNRQVQVQGLVTQQEVAHRAADEVDALTALAGGSCDCAEDAKDVGRETLVEEAGQIVVGNGWAHRRAGRSAGAGKGLCTRIPD